MLKIATYYAKPLTAVLILPCYQPQSFVGRPVIYESNIRYSSDSSDSLVSIECQSRTYIPTQVTWLRNNETVNTGANSLYQTMQIANTQELSSSYYRSVLVVRSVTGALGTQRYTCLLQNTFGSSSETVLLDRRGI